MKLTLSSVPSGMYNLAIMATTTRRTTRKTNQKVKPKRPLAKAVTSTARGPRHDYAEQIGVKVKNPVELVRHVEKGFGLHRCGGTATADASRNEGNGPVA